MGSELEKNKIPSTFLLARKEFKNAELNSDIWNFLQAIMNDKQMKEFLDKVEVVAGAYYSKDDEVTPEELEQILLKNPGKSYHDDKHGKIDNRTRKWCRLPLKDFVGTAIEKRKE